MRTQESLERLLDAAEALLSAKRFEDVHVAEVASRAGTSVAAFYRRFEDKEALLHALHERLCEQALATADDALAPARWEGAGIREILATSSPFLIRVLESRETLDLAVYQRGLTDAAFRERSGRISRHVMEGVARLLLARRAEIGHPDPERAVAFAMTQVYVPARAHVHRRLPRPALVRMSDEEIARELIESCLAYLKVRPPTP